MADSNSISIPPRVIDLTGHTFGKWTVLGYYGRSNGSTWWLCRCGGCGIEKPVRAGGLMAGTSRGCKSCGMTTHGKTETPECVTWHSIIGRCYRPKATGYARYGGRGITVCKRWRTSVANFIADMGPRPSSRHSIERIDNNGNYEPDNCLWATPEQQARNKRNNRMLTFQGRTMCLTAWAEAIGIAATTLQGRLQRGWSVKRALTTHGRVSRKETARSRSTNRTLEFNGTTLCLAEWAEITGINYQALYKRLTKYGWSIEKALTTPMETRKPRTNRCRHAP